MRAAARRRLSDSLHALRCAETAAESAKAGTRRHNGVDADAEQQNWNDQSLLALAARMQQAGGVPVRDRHYHLRLYQNCFVGSEAVAWMLRERVAQTVGEALRLGNTLLKLGLLAHVKHEHNFKDSYLFYSGDRALGPQPKSMNAGQTSSQAHQDPAEQKQQVLRTRAMSRLQSLAIAWPFIIALGAVLSDTQAKRPLLLAALLLAACASAGMWWLIPTARRWRAAHEGKPVSAGATKLCGAAAVGSGSSCSDPDVAHTFVQKTRAAEQAAGGPSLAAASAVPSSAAGLTGWPDRPCLLRLTPGVDQRLLGTGDPSCIPLHTDTAIRVQSELFEGTVRVWVKGLATTPADVFDGRRRRSHITVQGRFREPLSFDDVLTGQAFERLDKLPARWFLDKVLLRTARAVNPSVTFGPLSAPSMLVPAVAMSQAVKVSEPGSEPEVTAEEHEDMRLAGPAFVDAAGAPRSAAWRKRFLQKAENRRSCVFDPGKVYTFQMFQHLVDLAAYELHVSLYRFDLAHYLAGQPLRIMMQDRSGRPLFSLDVFHEKLVHSA